MSRKEVHQEQLYVLSDKIYDYKKGLCKVWGTDARNGHEIINRFKRDNSKAFAFLEIEASMPDFDLPKMQLTTSRYVGCVPILSPNEGKLVWSLSVVGRYGEDISEILSVIGDYIAPEFDESMKLSGNFLRPPLYFECQHYIDLYIEAKRYKWRKFDNIEKVQPSPSSSTRWDKYALASYDPERTLKYPNKCNILNREHPEWMQLNYVLDLCIDEVMSHRTPQRSRQPYINKINSLVNSYDKNKMIAVRQIAVHMSDPHVIKELKLSANRVLRNELSATYAWRIDYAEFFERYVQYLIKQVAQSKGARTYMNPKFNISGYHPSWGLSYLEPDMVVCKNDEQYIIDAKYKSHIYNMDSETEQLKETFRADLHQVIAYTSFSTATRKSAMLVYPSKTFVKRSLSVNDAITGNSCTVLLVGIPLSKADMEQTIKNLSALIKFGE